MASSITLRLPTTISAPTPSSTFTAPSIPWLTGTWHVTHSTLPMWKKSRNVCITYKPLESPSSTSSKSTETVPRLDDLVTYRSHSSPKLKTVAGIDTASGLGAWDWRGKGWLKIASSHWEVLGYGGEEGEEQWVVTYFAKTLFTPAGIDVYSRRKEGLSAATLEGIKEALKALDAESLKILAGQLFEIKSDGW